MRELFLRLRMFTVATLAREEGQDLPEYVLTFTVIALGCVAGMQSIAVSVNTVFLTVSTTLTTSV
jgi:Flp pilus assembly pilin Flp